MIRFAGTPLACGFFVPKSECSRMSRSLKALSAAAAIVLMTAAGARLTAKSVKGQPEVAEITGQGRPVLWREPVDIATRDLLYGSGGKKHVPRGPFTFDKEDLGGSNPKFDIRAADGAKWKVKLGIEARPETAAARLVWAAGYFVNDDYYVPELRVEGLPRKLHRGGKYVFDGIAYGVRLKRDPEGAKKIGIWKWKDNPLEGSREFNGLRTLMAVINNWDLKDINNAVYQTGGPEGPQLLFLVSDLGATFGTSGFSWTKSGSRGNLKGYRKSKFIRELTPAYVDFNVPARPALDHFPAIPELRARLRLRAIGRQIPRQDARWMGQLLGRLSPRQIRDAFRAAGYDAREVEGFSQVVESRIKALESL